MDYGNIAGSDKPVSRLVIGSMVCNVETMDGTHSLLDAFVAAGGTAIDTAHIYGGGKSEMAVGQWMHERGNRDSIFLIGKGAHPDANGSKVNSKGIAQDIAESLQRLQTNTIDLYLLHRDDTSVPVDEIVDILNKHKISGDVNQFGGSNWTVERIQAANDYAAQHGLQGFAASSPHLSLAASTEPLWGGCVTLDEAGKAWHSQTQMPLFPWSAQARGFFTGRFSPEDISNADMVRVYYRPDNWERLKRATELGADRGVSANNVALAWVLHQKFPVFALFGPANVEELDSSLPALELKLTDAETAWLNLETETV